MPIIIHWGPPRQGKSYSAIADQIVPALAKGRQVVTNIEGMASEERQALLLDLAKKRNPQLETINFTHINHSDLERGNVFPRDTKSEDADGTRIFDDSRSVLKFGALLVWDEARSFKTGELPSYWEDALTYHGHWARDGFATDLLLIHQNWKSLSPLVRATAELVYEFIKRPGGKGYTRLYYHAPGDRDLYRSKAELSETFSFDPAIYAVYKTNASDEAVNDNVTTTFWRTRAFRKLALLGGLFIAAAGGFTYWVTSRISDMRAPQKAVAATGSVIASPVVPTGTVGRGVPTIVGIVPTAAGDAALVRDGDRFVTVQLREGRVPWGGSYLPWPEDM